MKFRTILLLLAALAVGDVFAQVNALPPTRHILVYGDAQARAAKILDIEAKLLERRRVRGERLMLAGTEIEHDRRQ